MTKAKILVLGASGRVGSHLVRQFDKDDEGVSVRLATSRPALADQWRADGREAVVLDLNRPETLANALKGVDRAFLLTGYTSDMLYQSKKFVDAAAEAGVSHIVHLGVFSSREDLIPHFNWHVMIETYIEASGIAWTHLHPNAISDSMLVTDPPIDETASFAVFWKDVPQGWVFSTDIAEVAAAVLREGPTKHGGKNYWLSTEVLTGPEVAEILTKASGVQIKCLALGPEALRARAEKMSNTSERAYMESAVTYMELACAGSLRFQTTVRDDVRTVLGRSGTTMSEWARTNLGLKGKPID